MAWAVVIRFLVQPWQNELSLKARAGFSVYPGFLGYTFSNTEIQDRQAVLGKLTARKRRELCKSFVSCSLTPLGHQFKTQEEFAQFCLVAKLVLDCFGWPSKNFHSAAWPCHSHCRTPVKGFVHPASVIMDARRHKKV